MPPLPGGFNISLEPTFSPSRLTWLKAYGGVYVQARATGGKMVENRSACWRATCLATQRPRTADHRHTPPHRQTNPAARLLPKLVRR